MTKTDVLGAVDAIIEEAQVGVLATVDAKGKPALRWMTPTTVRGRPGYLYALTSPEFRKLSHLEGHDAVEWMFQTPELNRIVTVSGKMSVIDNPQLKSEVVESIGPRLEVFWRVNSKTEFIVLETAIERVTVFQPMKQTRDTVQLDEEDRR